MNKKKLYENIITSIAKSVKTKINESYSSSSDSYSETIDTEGEKLTVVIGDPCYVLDDDIYDFMFNSEKDACEYLGVVKCSVSSCFRKGSRCKGWRVTRIGNARMESEGE